MESKKNARRTPNLDTKSGHEQIYVSDYQLAFNLRARTNADKPTIIYAVVKGNGIKYRINSGVKVYPSQWNRRKQIAVESNELSALDNRNNAIANERLKDVRYKYDLAVERVKEKPDGVKEIIHIFAELIGLEKTMGEKKTKKQPLFTAVLSQININDGTVRESTKQSREQAIDMWKVFLQRNKLEDAPETVNRKNWIGFLDFLAKEKQKDGKTPKYKQKTIVQNLSVLKKLFLIYNGNLTDDQAYSIPTGDLKQLEVVKLTAEEEQSNYVIITESDIAKLYKVKLSNELYQTAKDLFLFQCCIGCRSSDLVKIITGDYKEQEHNGTTYINYTSKKTDIQAFVPIDTPTAIALYRWIKTLKKFPFVVAKDDSTRIRGTYNLHLKNAFHELNYTETRKVYSVSGGKKDCVEKPVWEMMRSHFARHSFITNMYYRGLSAEHIKTMSGHKDTKMIDDIYKQLDAGKEVERLDEILQKHRPVETGTDFTYNDLSKAIDAMEAMESVKPPKDITLAEVKALSKNKGGAKSNNRNQP